jgi:hypothetical protein
MSSFSAQQLQIMKIQWMYSQLPQGNAGQVQWHSRAQARNPKGEGKHNTTDHIAQDLPAKSPWLQPKRMFLHGDCQRLWMDEDSQRKRREQSQPPPKKQWLGCCAKRTVSSASMNTTDSYFPAEKGWIPDNSNILGLLVSTGTWLLSTL